jgi:hypothetical protein
VSKPTAHPSRLAAATVVRSDVGIILAKNLRNDMEHRRLVLAAAERTVGATDCSHIGICSSRWQMTERRLWRRHVASRSRMFSRHCDRFSS